MNEPIDRVHAAFTRAYDGKPHGIMRAPGRVNLIGEHTDYNDGFCLPIAIERAMLVAWRPRSDGNIRVVNAEAHLPTAEWSLANSLQAEPETPWYTYIQGCVQVLQGEGIKLQGCELAYYGDVPLGSGLSSSAALEVASIHALLAAAGQELPARRIAQLAQAAENQFVGVQCGILDQLSSACCNAGQAMLMDCRSLALSHVPMPEGVAVVIADTGKRRGLVDSAYNERRLQCEAGARALAVSHLRDVTLHGLMRAKEADLLDDLSVQRCQHVVAENGRTLAAAACLRAGDAVAMGQLMDQSHADLRQKFAVTCPELDHMVMAARELPGCLGARMTGAGFGGCTVSLVDTDRVNAFVPALLGAYAQKFALPAQVYVTTAAAGAGAC